MSTSSQSAAPVREQSRILRKVAGLYLSFGKRIWKHLPPSIRNRPAGRALGRHLDRIVRRQADRKQYFATFFLRNRAEMEMLRRVADQKRYGSRFDMTVLACSKGAEVYSMIWVVRTARPDLQLNVHAVDISQEIVDFAQKGVYSLSGSDALDAENKEAGQKKGHVSWNTSRDQNASMFERVSSEEIALMFDTNGDRAVIKDGLRQGITWMCGDAGDPALAAAIGPQDVVIANRFLCHMQPREAENCLRTIGQLVKPGGHLFVTGIDLDVREKVARTSGWTPVEELTREIHEGDGSILAGWPLEYWGLEPFDEGRPDWQVRYASVFEVGSPVPDNADATCLVQAQR